MQNVYETLILPSDRKRSRKQSERSAENSRQQEELKVKPAKAPGRKPGRKANKRKEFEEQTKTAKAEKDHIQKEAFLRILSELTDVAYGKGNVGGSLNLDVARLQSITAQFILFGRNTKFSLMEKEKETVIKTVIKSSEGKGRRRKIVEEYIEVYITPNILLDLPIEVARKSLSFLSFEDLRNLDVAWTNSDSRQFYLAILNKCIVPGSSAEIYDGRAIDWIIKRQVLVQKLFIRQPESKMVIVPRDKHEITPLGPKTKRKQLRTNAQNFSESDYNCFVPLCTELIFLRIQYQSHYFPENERAEIEKEGLYDWSTERKCARYIMKHAPHLDYLSHERAPGRFTHSHDSNLVFVKDGKQMFKKWKYDYNF